MADEDVRQQVLTALVLMEKERGTPFQATVKEIWAKIPGEESEKIGSPAVSYHLKALAEQGLIRTTSQGARKPLTYALIDSPTSSSNGSTQPATRPDGETGERVRSALELLETTGRERRMLKEENDQLRAELTKAQEQIKQLQAELDQLLTGVGTLQIAS